MAAVEPDIHLRRSFIYRKLLDMGAQFAPINGGAVAIDFGDDVRRERLRHLSRRVPQDDVIAIGTACALHLNPVGGLVKEKYVLGIHGGARKANPQRSSPEIEKRLLGPNPPAFVEQQSDPQRRR